MRTSMSWAKWKVVVNVDGKRGVVVYQPTKKGCIEALNQHMTNNYDGTWSDTQGNTYTVEKC